MAIRTQIRLVQLTGSLNDAVGKQALVDADSLQGVLDQTAAAIKRITGGATFSAQDAGEFSQTIKSDLPNNHDLGAVDGEWRDLFLGDDAEIQLGLDQDTKLTHIPDAGIRLNDGRSFQFRGADTKIFSAGANSLNLEAGNQMHLSGTSVELQATSPTGKVIVDSRELALEDDGVFISFGAGAPTTLSHIAANDALRLNGALKLEFRDATEFIHSDADGFMHLEGATGVHLAVNGVDEVAVTATESTFGGNILIPDAGYVGAASSVQALQIESDGDLNIVKDLVMRTNGSSIVNAGVDVVTFNATEVKIPGDLTVLGTTTTIDTANLEVEDKFIGLNYTSGSISGGAADVGLVLAQARGDNPTNIAFYYKQSANEFRAVQTASPASGSSITDSATFVDMKIADLRLMGLDVYGNGTGKAVELTTGNSPDVGVQNNLTLLDDKQIRLGALGNGGILQHAAGANKLIISASVGTGVVVGAGVSQTHAFQVADLTEMNIAANDVQIKTKLSSLASNPLVVSGSSGQELRLKGSGAGLHMIDAYAEAGGWSDIDGIKLAAAAADWANFEAAYGEVSLLAAITQAGGGAGTLQKRTVEVGAAGISTGAAVPLNLDLTALTVDEAQERVDIYVNGQLMSSGSEVSGNGDYALESPNDANTTVTFQFDLVNEDVVTGVVR